MVELWRIAIETDFAAAHTIPGHPKCGRMHGHNYRVEVCLEADRLDGNGFVLDFGVVKSALGSVVGALDHTYLNDSLPERYLPPSAENIAFYIFSELKERLPQGRTVCVRVWETPSQWAEYRP